MSIRNLENTFVCYQTIKTKIMQKLLLIVAFTAFIIFPAKSQDFFEAPDFTQIERNVKEQASTYYYPNLMKKYQNNASSIVTDVSKIDDDPLYKF